VPGAIGRAAEERIVSVAIWIAAVLVVAQTLLHLTNALLLDYRVWNMNADVDANALSWLSSVATFTAALAAASLAIARPGMRRRMAALAAVLMFFSLDDVVAIHEAVGRDVTAQLPIAPDLARIVWPAVFLPLLAFVAVVLFQARRHAPPRARRLLSVALVMLAVAIVAEGAWSTWYLRGGVIEDWPDAIEVAVEEALELAAWILIAGALFAMAAVRLSLAHEQALNGQGTAS
jgi:hypothetical protein